MLPNKAGLPVFLHCLLNYRFFRNGQLSPEVDHKGFQTTRYTSLPFPATPSGKFSSQLIITGRTTIATIEQVIQTFPVKDRLIPGTIQNSNFLNIKTLQV
jgi:hypothetical protein